VRKVVAVIAVLEVEFVDTSPSDTRGPNPDEVRRLQGTVARIRTVLGQNENYTVVDAEQVRALVRARDPNQSLHRCNGCELELGRALGADWVLVGWVQKVSNLILNLNVLVRDVGTGANIATAFVDLRGNTDKSWARATDYLLDTILLERLQRQIDGPRWDRRIGTYSTYSLFRYSACKRPG
jgi:muconolactone delta-isomerase